MIAPELRRLPPDADWPAGDGRRMDASPSAHPPAPPGRVGVSSTRGWIDRAVGERPWIVVTAAAIVGITAGWLVKRR